MRSDQSQDKPRSRGYLHRDIYAVMVGLAVWLVFSVWLFSGNSRTGVPLAVVSIFVLIAIGLPAVLWRIRRRNGPADPGGQEPLLDWLSAEFETWSGCVTARQAALEVLLPLAAVALGMTMFALVLRFDVGGA